MTIKLDLPCGCKVEHSFTEGEIVYFIEHEDELLERELFGFWISQKINRHICIATPEDIERYLLSALEIAYPYPKSDTVYNNTYLRNLVEVFARQDRKKII